MNIMNGVINIYILLYMYISIYYTHIHRYKRYNVIDTYLFPFEVIHSVISYWCWKRHLPLILVSHFIQIFGVLLVIYLIFADIRVRSPQTRIEAPMNRSIFQISVYVTDKLLRCICPMAFYTFDAPCVLASKQRWRTHSHTFTKTFMVNSKRKRTFDGSNRYRHCIV